MSQLVVQLNVIDASNINLNIFDNGYQSMNFNLFTNGFTKTTIPNPNSPINSIIYDTNIITTPTNNNPYGNNSNSMYNYLNTILNTPQIPNNLNLYTTSVFRTINNQETTDIDFFPLDISGSTVDTNNVGIRGRYFNTLSGYSSNFSANLIEIRQPDANLNTTFNFYNINNNNNTKVMIGQIIYNPSQNTYTANSSNSLLNYQNLIILANKSIIHFSNYPNDKSITPLIFKAMFEMNSYAFNRLLNYV